MARHDAHPPEHVTIPVMRHRWETITFLHWPYPSEVVQSHLPRGLEVETWDEQAWVGLVPFGMVVRPPVGPGAVRFPETNVRTYVVGPDGRPGVWFFSLDAASTSAVAAARATWQLPYYLAAMSVTCHDDEVHYLSARRRPPAHTHAEHDIRVRPGEPIQPTEFDHYLTARFTLWNALAGTIMRTAAEHPPWELRHAEVLHCDEDLVTAAGLPEPSGDAVVHYSDGVDVRIGAPRLVSSHSARGG